MFEIASLLGVTRQRVHQITSEPDFPQPVARLNAGAIWLTTDVETWRNKMRPLNTVRAPEVPARDPERPQDDPWDANVVRFLMSKPEGAAFTRGELMECLREQPGRVKRMPGRVQAAAALAEGYGVQRRRDPGGKTMHFFRSDAQAPPSYPASDAERRAWLNGARDTLS